MGILNAGGGGGMGMLSAGDGGSGTWVGSPAGAIGATGGGGAGAAGTREAPLLLLDTTGATGGATGAMGGLERLSICRSFWFELFKEAWCWRPCLIDPCELECTLDMLAPPLTEPEEEDVEARLCD